MDEGKMKMMAGVAWNMPRLIMGAGVAVLRHKRRARKSAKKFYKGLRKAGMDKETAKIFTEKYEETASIRKMMNMEGGIPGVPKGVPFFGSQ